jgi:hypothetical protein
VTLAKPKRIASKLWSLNLKTLYTSMVASRSSIGLVENLCSTHTARCSSKSCLRLRGSSFTNKICRHLCLGSPPPQPGSIRWVPAGLRSVEGSVQPPRLDQATGKVMPMVTALLIPSLSWAVVSFHHFFRDGRSSRAGTPKIAQIRGRPV